jgi:deoxyribodipyrimidine photo-lyase
MRVMVWFRSDLRTGDHQALSYATREADRGVIGVFVVSPGQWNAHDWGAPKVDFVLRNAAALRADLHKLNIPLRIVVADRFADAPGALLGLARETKCDALYFSRELEVNEVDRDERVTDAFEEAGLRVRAFDDVCVLPPGEVRTQEGGWYTVYSPFRKRFGAVWDERGGTPPSPKPRKQPQMACDSDEVPTSLDGFDPVDLAERWPAGESHARKQLERFIRERIGNYSNARNHPAEPATSALSPYLAAGVISPRECIVRAMEAEGRDSLQVRGGKTGPGQWIDEVLWREFYKHLLVGHPRLSKRSNFRTEYDGLAWREDQAQFDAWCDGRTGVPIVDAAMRQLLETGWMHNRCRMITAMFLTKNLLMDWRLGERHFMNSLVDADLASNNGGWQWSASTGTDAAPYFRIFNPTTQSAKFDPEGAYIRRYVPELADLDAKEIHDPPPMARAGAGYPEPIVDVKASRERAIRAFEKLRG